MGAGCNTRPLHSIYSALLCSFSIMAERIKRPGGSRIMNTSLLCCMARSEDVAKLLEFVMSRISKSRSSRTNPGYPVWAGLAEWWPLWPPGSGRRARGPQHTHISVWCLRFSCDKIPSEFIPFSGDKSTLASPPLANSDSAGPPPDNYLASTSSNGTGRAYQNMAEKLESVISSELK